MNGKRAINLCAFIALFLLSFAKLRDPFFYDFIRYPVEVYMVIGIARIRPADQYFAVIRVWQRLHYVSVGDKLGFYIVKEICSRHIVLEDAQKKLCRLYVHKKPACETAINSA